MDVVARLEAVRRKHTGRGIDTDIAPEQIQAPKQFPYWPDAVRGVPNAALRSALFGAIKKGRRPYLERQEIHAQQGVSILYTGPRLDQGDLDVWATVLHVARTQALGSECRVTAYQLLKLLGNTDTGKNRVVLDRHLSRMKATALDVRVGRYAYEGSLIDEVYRDRIKRGYVIQLNPRLQVLFASDQFTQADWSVRHALKNKPLAQWLHGYYSTHATPFPVSIATLYRLCGSEASELWKFAQTLRAALELLTVTSGEHGQPFNYSIRGDLVYVERHPSGAQRRHLVRRLGHKS